MMEKTRKTLKSVIWLSVALALALVVLFETHTMPAGTLAADGNDLFVATMVMALLSLAMIPLAISLLHMPFIRKRLTADNQREYIRWAVLRIGLLAFLMIANALCYYLFAGVAFGYLAIIAFLCLMVVYPTRERCANEMNQNNSSPK